MLFKQSEGMCGPASVRIAMSAFGKSFTEEEVAKLTKSSVETGTAHEDLVEGLKKAGIHCLVYSDLAKNHALEVIKNYNSLGKPIIVDWMKTKLLEGGDVVASEGMKPGVEEAKSKKDIDQEKNEHYSVIKSVDDKNITLLDPLETQEEVLPIKYFMDRWFTKSENVKRWFVVLENES
jgi:predicted double-glycine peptidase